MSAETLARAIDRYPARARHALIGALLLGFAASEANAASATIGRTWPIAEPDAMAEIEARASQVPDMAARFGPRSGWSAMKTASLPPAQENRVRTLVPFYTVEADIRLPDGRVLYPKGFTFNPLEYVSLPQQLVIVHPRDLGWAIARARLSDFILLTAGDAIALSEKTGRPLFILEQRVKERLGLTVAPVIVAQEGKRLVLTEYVPLRTSRRSDRP